MTDKSFYLAIDPGETAGWASFKENGDLLAMGQFRWVDFTDWANEHMHSELKHVIAEQYVNYAWKRQKNWSDNKTSKMIGKIELMADLRGIPCTLQPANVKEIGAMWGGFEIPAKRKNGIDHQFVAAAHGIYWLQSNGIRHIGQFMRTKAEDDS